MNDLDDSIRGLVLVIDNVARLSVFRDRREDLSLGFGYELLFHQFILYLQKMILSFDFLLFGF